MFVRGARPVSAIEIKGVDALRQRLQAIADPRRFKETLKGEAEAIAEDARREVPAELAQSIEVRYVRLGNKSSLNGGHIQPPLGSILEFGTLRRPASPWLWPIFRARLPAIKEV